jgi:hypothetical protein
MTRVLKCLEAMGYVQRSRDPKDERNVRIALTEAGTALSVKGLGMRKAVVNASGLAPRNSRSCRRAWRVCATSCSSRAAGSKPIVSDCVVSRRRHMRPWNRHNPDISPTPRRDVMRWLLKRGGAIPARRAAAITQGVET